MSVQTLFTIVGKTPTAAQCIGLFGRNPTPVTFTVKLDDGSKMEIVFTEGNDGDQDSFTVSRKEDKPFFRLQAQAHSSRGSRHASVEMIAEFRPGARTGGLRVRYSAYAKYLFEES